MKKYDKRSGHDLYSTIRIGRIQGKNKANLKHYTGSFKIIILMLIPHRFVEPSIASSFIAQRQS